MSKTPPVPGDMSLSHLCSALGILPSACFNLVIKPLSCYTVIRGLGLSKPLLSKLQLGPAEEEGLTPTQLTQLPPYPGPGLIKELVWEEVKHIKDASPALGDMGTPQRGKTLLTP